MRSYDHILDRHVPNEKDNFFEQIFLVVLIYFFSSIFISIPYIYGNYSLTFVNAFFESISGLTTTGFSVLENIKYLDPTLILWRSSSQWIGSFYFLIFLLIVFSNKQFNYKLTYLVFDEDIAEYFIAGLSSFFY